MNIVIRDSISSDVRNLSNNIRETDLREALGLGEESHKLLFRLYRHAVYRKTAEVDGKIAAMWGVNGTLFGTTGIPYFVTGKDIEEVVSIKVARIYLQEVKVIQGMFPHLEHYVDVTHTKALKLLKLAGFTWSTVQIKGLNGVEFYQVIYNRPLGITMQTEKLFNIIDEIMELANKHGDEFTYNKDIKGDVNPNFDLASILDQHDRIRVVTIRDNNKLIGYFVFTLQPMAHYRNILMAAEDTFYLLPEYRGKSFGYRFLKYAVDEMKKTGAKVLKVANKVKADYRSLWERLGFEQEEIIYTQVVN
jgi:GNAT superfamily N-acetyltransferase